MEQIQRGQEISGIGGDYGKNCDSAIEESSDGR